MQFSNKSVWNGHRKRQKFEDSIFCSVFVELWVDFVDYNVKTPKYWEKLLFRWAFVERKAHFVKNCLKLTLKVSINLKFLSFLVQFLYNFREIWSKFQHNQQRKTELCSTFSEENVAAFCFKNTSEWVQIFVFMQIVSTFWIVLESDRWQTFNKDWTHTSWGF